MQASDYLEIDYSDLEIYELCGNGSFGSVYCGLWKSRNKTVAIKKLLNLKDEANVLSSCSHRNIIQFFGAVSKSPNYCIVTEYAEYGSLQNFISTHKELKLELLLKLAHDIALGMNYLHSEAPHKIIHRDLKSNNVLIKSDDGDDYICKICDFGSSRFGVDTAKMSINGTFPWMSPEIIQEKPANSACDIWSYGVVLWELITGETPFKGIENMQIAFLVVCKEQRLPIPASCPEELASLMRQCWQTEPKARPTFKQILTQLDQIDFDVDAKAEIDRQFKTNKPKWEKEIEIAFEKLKKIEDDLHLKERLLEEREHRLRLMEMELISTSSKLNNIKDHDVNTWGEDDVFDWIKNIGAKNELDLCQYSELFRSHNINGKRLLMMDEDALRKIGITSVGHIIELDNEIQKLRIENTRLLNFPPLKKTYAQKSPTTQRTVSFHLLVGSHILFTGQKPEEYKWKMFIDLDECITDDDLNSNEPFHVYSCIRDVKFTRNAEQFIVHRPPFIMKHWSKGNLVNNKNEEQITKINCTIIYDDNVIQPRKTTIEYQLNPKQQQQIGSTPTLLHTVSITLEENEKTVMNKMFYEKRNLSISTASNVSTNTSTAIALINSNLQFQNKLNSPTLVVSVGGLNSGFPGDGNVPIPPINVFNGIKSVWTEKNLENAVNIPEITNSTKNLSVQDSTWARIVSTNQKPIICSQIKSASPSSSLNSSNADSSIKTITNSVIKKNFSHSNLPMSAKVSFGRQQSATGVGRGKPKINENQNSNSYNFNNKSGKK